MSLAMTEKDLQQNVLDLAALCRWRTFHVFDSRRSNPGWPDLVLVREERLLFVELKSAKGRLSDAQEDWLAALSRVAWCAVWRPEDWLNGTIENILK